MKKVVLDCGTNFGQGISLLSRNYQFDPSWDIYLFEPNPYFKEKIQKNIIDPNPGINISLIEKAVCGRNLDTVKFFVDPTLTGIDGSLTTSESSTILNEELGQNECKDYKVLEVGALRLSNIIRQIASEHSTISNGKLVFNKGSLKLVVKLDIEGAEYEVLKDLLETGTAWAITDLYIEFHSRRFKNVEEKELEQDFLVSQLYRRGINLFPHY